MTVLIAKINGTRKGGTARAVRRMIVWLLVLTTAFVVLCWILIPRKHNYTELHRVVADIARRVEVLEGYHD